MAGETSAELTIVVRAQDAATRTIIDIGKTIGKVLLSPLKFVGKAVGDILKQFFSLKTLLVGGGIIGVMSAAAKSLAKNAKEFEAVFAEDVQRKIDNVASAFNKLGASIKSVFGSAVADSGIADLLNMLSDFLRNNKDTVVEWVKILRDGLRDIAALIKSIVSGGGSIGKFLGVSGDSILNLKFDSAAGADARRAAIRQEDIWRRATSLASAPSVAQEIAGESYEALMDAFDAITASGGEGTGAGSALRGSDRLGELNRIGRDLARINASWLDAGPVVERVAQAMADAFGRGKGEQGAIDAGLRAAADEAERFSDHMKGAAEIVAEVAPATDKAAESTGKLAEAYHEVVQEAKAAIIAFDEVADTIAGNVTDGLFAFIEGTQSAGRAFASMVSSILRELSRLLIYRSLLKAILSIGGSAAGSAAGSGGAFTSESGTAGFTSTSFASGGRSYGGVATVGENGPERVFLPRGAEVVPSQRSRAMGGGDTINVYGARDPKATAREVAYERRRSAGLRRALA